MNAAPSAEPIVVLALDASKVEDYVMDLAGRLSASLSAELLGLFVENTGLLELAGSRRAREVLLTGATRALDRTRLERQLRAQAERARSRFEAATARSGLRHRFEIARGDIVDEPARRASSAQALVLTITQAPTGPMSAKAVLDRLTEAGPRVLLLARAGWTTGANVAVMAQDIVRDAAAIEAAARMARSAKSPLRILLGPDGPDIERIEGIVHAHGPLPVEIVRLADAAGIAMTARALRARLLVIRWPAEQTEVERIAHEFGGALMLVRS